MLNRMNTNAEMFVVILLSRFNRVECADFLGNAGFFLSQALCGQYPFAQKISSGLGTRSWGNTT